MKTNLSSCCNAEEEIAIKGYTVCFKFNKRCMQGNIVVFNKRKNAKKYIHELHKRIGGFEEDHHIVPCTITFKLKKKNGKL